jgi:2-furoyl-CoA dehydrogenase 2Fe-2S iron sulfur subunit
MRRVNKDERARVAFTLNGRPAAGEAEPRMLLTDFLRHVIGSTGTHVGCEHGVCGCCTVLIDGAAVRGCLTLAVQAEGRSVTTVESRTARSMCCSRRSSSTMRCNAASAPRVS